MKVTTTEDPPKLMSGNGIPVTGSAAGLLTGVGTGLTALMDGDYRVPYTHERAFAIMEGMGGKLDKHLLQAFRPVALGSY